MNDTPEKYLAPVHRITTEILIGALSPDGGLNNVEAIEAAEAYVAAVLELGHTRRTDVGGHTPITTPRW